NLSIVQSHAATLQQDLVFLATEDFMQGKAVTGELAIKLRRLVCTYTDDLLGFFPALVNMRVMVMETMYMPHSIVNGKEGYLRHVDVETRADGNTYPICAFVEFPGCGIRCDGLPDDVAPIFPVESYLSYESKRVRTKFSFKHVQLPLLPAYAYTDYKSQGCSLETVIVDIAGARSLQSLYVMLS
ncbi:hypothetical protein OF83DRAFT_1067508, partial [Amylostereum chailletii]